MGSVSIIIPALNEERSLGRTLRCLSILDPAPVEVILVDGGSQDGTVAIAESFGVKVLRSEQAGRSRQMNRGARVATGDYLCFLHADTLVPDDLVALIDKTLTNPEIACGGFISLMTGHRQTRWLTSFHNFAKTYYAPLLFRPHLFFRGLRLLFGDQVMFCRKDDFWQCDGFNPELPVMEEADLCRKFVRHRLGRIVQLNRVVWSSDRRLEQWGSLKANAVYLMIGFLWGMGVSAIALNRFYKDIR